MAFDRLGLDFWLDSRGISIAGHCPGPPGAVAVAAGRAILTEPELRKQPQPVAALIQALVPGNEVPIPATRQTSWLSPPAAGPRCGQGELKRQEINRPALSQVGPSRQEGPTGRLDVPDAWPRGLGTKKPLLYPSSPRGIISPRSRGGAPLQGGCLARLFHGRRWALRSCKSSFSVFLTGGGGDMPCARHLVTDYSSPSRPCWPW